RRQNTRSETSHRRTAFACSAHIHVFDCHATCTHHYAIRSTNHHGRCLCVSAHILGHAHNDAQRFCSGCDLWPDQFRWTTRRHRWSNDGGFAQRPHPFTAREFHLHRDLLHRGQCAHPHDQNPASRRYSGTSDRRSSLIRLLRSEVLLHRVPVVPVPAFEQMIV